MSLDEIIKRASVDRKGEKKARTDLGVTHNSCTFTFILNVIWLMSTSHTDHNREEMKTQENSAGKFFYFHFFSMTYKFLAFSYPSPYPSNTGDYSSLSIYPISIAHKNLHLFIFIQQYSNNYIKLSFLLTQIEIHQNKSLILIKIIALEVKHNYTIYSITYFIILFINILLAILLKKMKPLSRI